MRDDSSKKIDTASKKGPMSKKDDGLKMSNKAVALKISKSSKKSAMAEESKIGTNR